MKSQLSIARQVAFCCIALVLLLPLSPVTTQRAAPPPESLPPWEHDAGGPGMRAWETAPTAESVEAARPSSFLWHTEQADAPPLFSAMGPRSLALDAAGHPHIAYGEDHLYYAWYDGVAWQVEVADSATSVGRFTSLALDGAGQAHISYYDTANGDLKYAHSDGASWQRSVVDSIGPVEAFIALALDTLGRPHISYLASNGHLKYAFFDGATWQIATVDSSGDAGSFASLALDAADRPHIGYYDHTNANLRYAVFDGANWQLSTVDSAGDVGRFPSLVLDPAGRPHISYADWSHYDLRYARFDGSAWLTETVDSEGSPNWWNSLALDAADRPHISYCDNWPYDDLKYARFDGSAWLTETVDSTGGAGWWNSLALDAADRPHISYYGYSDSERTGDLRYSHFDGSGWLTETVDSAATVGWYTSLALDSAGRPHISYIDFIDASWPLGDLKYAYFDGTAWQVERVDRAAPREAQSVAAYTSLALDALGHPHISYYNEDWDVDGQLRYATFDGTLWTTTTVDSHYTGWWSSLKLDAAGRPHISYHDPVHNDLKYAYFDGSAWLTETVDSAGVVGGCTSLALDSSDRPHISYYDATNLDLKYAAFDGLVWQIETVDSAGDVGAFTSLALDAAGRPHISYYGIYGPGESYLLYARFDGSAWLTETVDSAGDVGWYTSLALDANDRPHIGYWDVRSADLRYAYFDGTAWLTETVDSAGRVGEYASLALDAAGLPHISYYDGTNYDLKYAYATCVPLEGVSVSGPDLLLVGETGIYSATYTPITASLPIAFTWDNGSVGPTAAYSWTLPGVYTLTVTATNFCAREVAWRTVAVTDVPIEGLIAANDSPTVLCSATALSATVESGTNVSYTWAFGDGDTDVGPAVTHTYPAVGIYAALVTASNSVSMLTTTTVVTVEEAIAGLSASNDSPTAFGSPTALTATMTSGSNVSYTWAFGDGGVGVGAAVGHTYPAVGIYTALVTASNSVSMLTATTVITVEEAIAGLSASNDSPTTLGGPTALTATVESGTNVSYTWAFGDGGASVGAAVAHTYPAVGIYTAVVTASNPVSTYSTETMVMIIAPTLRVYLPLVYRNH